MPCTLFCDPRACDFCFICVDALRFVFVLIGSWRHRMAGVLLLVFTIFSLKFKYVDVSWHLLFNIIRVLCEMSCQCLSWFLLTTLSYISYVFLHPWYMLKVRSCLVALPFVSIFIANDLVVALCKWLTMPYNLNRTSF